MKIVLAVLLTVATGFADHHNSKEGKEEKASQASVVVGILDQDDEEFIVGKDKGLTEQVSLRAEGFTPDNFAKFVGQRVHVQGKFGMHGTRKIITVTNLENIKTLPPEEK